MPVLEVIRNDEPNYAENSTVVRYAKNLAWELRPDSPMFEDGTMDGYWRALPRGTKLRYIAAVEAIIMGQIADIDRAQACNNATKVWLHTQLIEGK